MLIFFPFSAGTEEMLLTSEINGLDVKLCLYSQLLML